MYENFAQSNLYNSQNRTFTVCSSVIWFFPHDNKLLNQMLELEYRKASYLVVK